jgi:hypothetical protein
MIQQKINPAELGFDFDGVIADTAEAFIRLACDEYNICNIRIEDITHFEVEECLAIDPEIIQMIFMKILLNSVETGLKPMPHAIEVLGALSEKSTITLITARSEAKPVTDWLKTKLPHSTVERINVVAMGSHNDKLQHIKNQNLSYFIDDRAETCLQLNTAGINPFVFSQPWNQGRHQLPSVNNWLEIRDLCL